MVDCFLENHKLTAVINNSVTYTTTCVSWKAYPQSFLTNDKSTSLTIIDITGTKNESFLLVNAKALKTANAVIGAKFGIDGISLAKAATAIIASSESVSFF
jgi:hypothetical protein